MFSADPWVDIIIPCYNAGPFIIRTLESALNQTYEKVNIVVVDDGSTDGTLDILLSYGPKIKVLRHPDNGNHGAPASLNLGISASTADYVAFLDADDIFYPDKIEKQVRILSEKSNIGLVYTNGHAIDENDTRLYRLFSEDHVECNNCGDILVNCYISAGSSTVMVRRNLFERVGLFSENVKCTYDHDMWIRLKEVSEYAYIPELLMAYRRHSGQQSTRRTQWEGGFYVLNNAMKRYPYGRKIYLRRLAVLYFRLGSFDVKNGFYLRGYFNLALSFICDPLRAFKVIMSKEAVNR